MRGHCTSNKEKSRSQQKKNKYERLLLTMENLVTSTEHQLTIENLMTSMEHQLSLCGIQSGIQENYITNRVYWHVHCTVKGNSDLHVISIKTSVCTLQVSFFSFKSNSQLIEDKWCALYLTYRVNLHFQINTLSSIHYIWLLGQFINLIYRINKSSTNAESTSTHVIITTFIYRSKLTLYTTLTIIA